MGDYGCPDFALSISLLLGFERSSFTKNVQDEVVLTSLFPSIRPIFPDTFVVVVESAKYFEVLKYASETDVQLIYLRIVSS